MYDINLFLSLVFSDHVFSSLPVYLLAETIFRRVDCNQYIICMLGNEINLFENKIACLTTNEYKLILIDLVTCYWKHFIITIYVPSTLIYEFLEIKGVLVRDGFFLTKEMTIGKLKLLRLPAQHCILWYLLILLH